MNNIIIANRYKLLSSIGTGGMADVYLAYDLILHREVAIKIIRGDLHHDPIAIIRFKREAEAISKLDHPNIVQIYDVGEYEKTRPYIVMEYVRGKTLKQFIQQRGSIGKEEAIEIVRQIASGLAHAHRQKIIHRDIKPQNILIKDDNSVKLTDFGIAMVQESVQLTNHDIVLGSAEYLAPEVLKGEKTNTQMDIYALGIVLYELLTGKVPFSGENLISVATKHLQEEIPELVDDSIPQSVKNIIIKATIKNCKHRYQSVEEMLEDLKKCLWKEYTNVPKYKPVEEKVVEQEENQHKKWIPIIIGISVVFCLTITFILVLLKNDKPKIQTVQIPDIIGISKDQAKAQLEQLGFEVEISVNSKVSKEYAKDSVIDSTPKIKTALKKGSKVVLTLSKGTNFVIDNYIGKTVEEVEQLFKNEKLNISIITYKVSEPGKEVGTIAIQEILKPGKEIDPERFYQIKFGVVDYTSFVIPSNLEGKNYKEVQKELQDLGGIVHLKKVKLPTKIEIVDGKEQEVEDTDLLYLVKSVSPDSKSVYSQTKESFITVEYYDQ